jgi:hypothetical protein
MANIKERAGSVQVRIAGNTQESAQLVQSLKPSQWNYFGQGHVKHIQPHWNVAIDVHSGPPLPHGKYVCPNKHPWYLG